MKKIIRTNNLQKALEDYDALKGQPVIYVDTLPVSPNIRSAVYCKTITTDNTFARVLTPVELVQLYGELDTEGHYKILSRFNVQYDNTRVRSIAFAEGLAIMYEDDAYTDALPEQFTDDATYHFVVIVSTTEKAFYVGDAANQTLNPTVTFAEIERLDTKMDSVMETFDAPKVGGDGKYIVSVSESKGVIHAVEGSIDNTVTENSANLITSGAVFASVSEEASLRDNAISNAINDLVSNITNDLNVANLVATNATITDLNVTNVVANKLVADDANIDNATITNLIANGVAGNDGQVLGKVNGNIEWVSTGIDTNDFSVNHLTVNNSASVNGNNFTHKGFDVTSMTVISEDEYNNLSLSARGSAFYMTTPNGNMYFHGVKFAPQGMVHEYAANVNLPNMAYNKSTLTTSTLTFTKSAVTNNFVNGGAYTGIKNITAFGESWDNSAPVGTQANDGNIITNATQGLYITNAAGMFSNCKNMTDCFITNPALRINAPENYDPMKYCKDMSSAFSICYRFNQPVTIPNSVNNIACMFFECHNFNQPVTIPNSVRDMSGAFDGCNNFDQPVTIPNNCNAVGALSGTNFTQNLYVPNNTNVTDLFNTPSFRTIKMDTLTFESGFIASNVASVGFGMSLGKKTICNNLVISGEGPIGFGISLYAEDANNLVNGNSVTIQSVPSIDMVSSNIYLNCNIYGMGIDEDEVEYFVVPLVNLGSYLYGNVHIPSKYSVNTTNAPINIRAMYDSYKPDIMDFRFFTQNKDELNSIITQYLTTGWNWSGNVWDTKRRGNVFVNIHLGIGHNFTGHIINDL